MHNLCDRNAAFLSFGPFYFVAFFYFPLAQDREIEPGAFALEKPFQDVATIKSDPKFVARHPRLRDHELGGANAKAIAYSCLILQNPFGREVLAEGSHGQLDSG